MAKKKAAKKAKKKAVAKKKVAKKTAAPKKKAAKKVAKKAAPKKTVAKKAAKKVAAPKKVAKKAAPKKTVAKKAAKKVAAPKAIVKKVLKKIAKKVIKKATIKKVVEKVAKKVKITPIEIIIPEDDIILEEEVVLTDADGNRYCRVSDCDQTSMVDGYCRYHYLMFWKRIQVRKKILADGKLEKYIDELTIRYSDKFLEILRKDLRTEKDFLATVHELDLDQDDGKLSDDEEETSTYIEEIRGVSSDATKSRGDDYN